jgi:hypothetical protein
MRVFWQQKKDGQQQQKDGDSSRKRMDAPTSGVLAEF